jgi:hypothetical protein
MKSIRTILSVLFVIAALGLSSASYLQACDHDDEYTENESD